MYNVAQNNANNKYKKDNIHSLPYTAFKYCMYIAFKSNDSGSSKKYWIET